MFCSRWLPTAAAGILLALLSACGSGDATGPGSPPAASVSVETRKATDPPPPVGFAYVYRFAKISNGAYFYTGSTAERDQILALFPDFRYEGIAFLQTVAGPSTPVYRFANLGNGGYFYTASTAERDEVIRSRKDMRFEGSTYAVAPESDVAASPVFRLANLRNGAYLYTYSAAERDFAVGLGYWRYEGVSFRAAVGTTAPIVTKEFEVIAGGAACGTRGCNADSPDGAGVGGGDSAGAGGDGGVGGSSGESAARNVTIVAYKPDGTVLGSAPLVNNLVSLYPRTYKGPFFLKMVDDGAGEYWDEATRQWMPLGGQTLHAMVPTATHHVSINPLTEAAYQLAIKQLRSESSLNAATMKQYNDIVLAQINAKLPAAYQINDITNFATTLDDSSGPDTIPNTWAGRFSTVLAGMPIAGARFNSKLGAPALDYGRHLTADLLDDGLLNASATVAKAAYDATQAAMLQNGVCTSTATWGSADLPSVGAGSAAVGKAGQLALLAGSTAGDGNCDGLGTNARFRFPGAMAADSAGNLYVADTLNSLIRKITPQGRVTTLAGAPGVAGFDDGQGPSARFFFPTGVAVDTAGNVYVADSGAATIRKITPAGVVTTMAGSARQMGSADGTGSSARFNSVLAADGSGTFGNGVDQPFLLGPSMLTVAPSGVVYVADTFNHTIRRISPAGVVTTVAGLAGQPGSADGSGGGARFNRPLGLVVDGAGNLYVADSGNSTLRRITPSGQVTTVAGLAGQSGAADGTGTQARLGIPYALALDGAGNILISDYTSSVLRKSTPAGVVTSLGRLTSNCSSDGRSADGALSAATFCQAAGVAVDASATVYVVDTFEGVVRKLSPAGAVTTLAGSALRFGASDGTGSTAEFGLPMGIALAGDGNIFVADQAASTIRKISPTGVVTTIAGLGGASGTADGPGSLGRFMVPTALAFDRAGNLYVTDSGAHTVRKVSPAGSVSTFAGSPGQAGSVDGPGALARFLKPTGIAVDASDNVFVYDCGNRTLRRISPSGIVITLAGTTGQFGPVDGRGAAARFGSGIVIECDRVMSGGLAVDASNNIFMADTGNNLVRRITQDGTVTTIAGSPGVGGHVNGSGSAVRFFAPRAIASDLAGGLYVVDYGNSAIRRISPSGVVSTIVGTPPVSANQTGALPGALSRPNGVAAGPDQRLFITSGVAIMVATPFAGGWR